MLHRRERRKLYIAVDSLWIRRRRNMLRLDGVCCQYLGVTRRGVSGNVPVAQRQAFLRASCQGRGSLRNASTSVSVAESKAPDSRASARTSHQVQR